MEELWTMVQESLDEVLKSLFKKAQIGMLSVVYNIFEQVMLDLPRKDVIQRTLDEQKARISTKM